MYPILISLGPIVIYTANIFYILGWGVFSYMFWHLLRAQGMLEERIFDLTFYATLIGLIAARLGFVFLYPGLFTASILLVGAFWVQPGLWLYSGLVGATVTLFLLSKRFHVRFAHVFDAFVLSFVWAMIPVLLGVFFQGAEVGKQSNLPWAIPIAHYDGYRHPIQLYEILVFLIVGIISLIIERRSRKAKWKEGFTGSFVLCILTPMLFGLEFVKDARVYLYGISVNQWLLILIFGESCGSVIVKGNAKDIVTKIQGGFHEWTTKRFRTRDQRKIDKAADGSEEEN